jgi:hypothetical protein
MNKWEDELGEVYALLDGWVENDRSGLPHVKRFKPNSEHEERARTTIARLLLERRINGQILDQLAALFDPRPRVLPDETAHPDFLNISEYRIKIVQRRRGRPGINFTNNAIAEQVWNRVQSGATVDASIDATAKKINKSKEHVRDIWGRFRKYKILQKQWAEE